MLKFTSRRALLQRSSTFAHHISNSKVCSVNDMRYFTNSSAKHNKNNSEIRSLEDLAKLKSLDDVDPKLIKKLINERTSELNIQNELELLKTIGQEEKRTQDLLIKRFIRPLWVFLLMSSSFYLLCHYLWWKLEYDGKEEQLKKETHELEYKLLDMMKQEEIKQKIRSKNDGTGQTGKAWYAIW